MGHKIGMTIGVPTIPAPAERRIRREARSETMRELAWTLRQRGWTLANIGLVLGVSTTRVLQILRKAERLISENETGNLKPRRAASAGDAAAPASNSNRDRGFGG